jgi:hypothetical protein
MIRFERHENHSASAVFKHLHDNRLVRPPEIPQGSASRRNRRELADRVRGILFQVPANRIGYGQFSAFQLKIIQEMITLCVFVVFAWWYLGEEIKWNHAVSFLFQLGAVTFAFWGKS